MIVVPGITHVPQILVVMQVTVEPHICAAYNSYDEDNSCAADNNYRYLVCHNYLLREKYLVCQK